MEFMKSLKKEATKTFTENGAVGYSTTGQALLDFNFKIPSFRADVDTLFDSLSAVTADKDPYIFKYLYYLRDCRAGLGERDAFRNSIMYAIWNTAMTKEEVVSLIKHIPEYGRWDDLLIFIDTEFESIACDYIKEQLDKDLTAMAESKPASLLAKWLPSDNTSSKKARYYAHKLAKYFGISVRNYRKTLVALRKYIDVTEVKACANNWQEIDYSKVSSQANIKYKDAFLKHDKERRTQYLKDLAAGKDGVVIHSATNFPHDIVHSYAKTDLWHFKNTILDIALEELWKNLPDMPGLDNTLVIRDGSGSMTCPIPGSNASALEVADALSLYCAARCKGIFKDTFITFSSKPEVVSVVGKDTLLAKLRHLRNYNDCSNTNLEAMFDLILRTAINANLTQEEMPKQLLIISDMEFDAATCDYNYYRYDAERQNFLMKTLMETIAAKYKEAGYILPKLVFWNVNSRTNTIPITENQLGVTLISGFSIHAINMVLSGELDPYKAIISAIEVDRYKEIPLARY